MTGQIPRYGKHFRLVQGEYDPEYNSSLYISKNDVTWVIRSDKTSKKWYIFHYGHDMGVVFPSLTVAMTKVVTILETLGMI